MEVRTFHAATLQEALQQVRQTLGPEASVLHTRELRKHRFGVFSKRIIEVEASRDVPVTPQFHQPSMATSVPTSSGGDAATEVARQPDTHGTGPGSHDDQTARSVLETRSAASQQPSPQHPAISQSAYDSQPPATHAAAVPDLPMGSPLSAPSVETRESARPSSEMPRTPAKFEVLSEMLDAGIEVTAAKSLLLEASERCPDEQQDDPWLLRGQVSQLISARMKTCGPLEIVADEQKLVAFVGPTGVGKTTTLAKIAAGFRFDLGCQVGLITLDTFRLGAVDQLLQYAELISAPLEVVSSPDEVTGALQRLRECDLVLLDTAGRAPQDSLQLHQLRDFLRAAQPHSVQLVVSATSSLQHAQETLRQFSTLEPSNLLLTKLDEAIGFGQWLSLLQACELDVSYLTAGQQVPQDISVASPRRLASMLLGQSQYLQTTTSMLGRHA